MIASPAGSGEGSRASSLSGHLGTQGGMRNKIIAVNAVIVLLVGLLSFAIVKTQLSLATSSNDQLKRSAQHDAAGVAAKLQLDALRAERWLSIKASEPATRASLTKATPDARADAARALADQL